MIKKLLILLSILPLFASAQGDMVFIKNAGQWDSRIEFNQILGDGNLYLEKDGFTYSLYDKTYINSLHNDKKTPPPTHIKSHAVQTKFLNSNTGVKIVAEDSSSFYYNYFIGEDKSKWKSFVRLSSKIKYENLYDGIDLKIYNEFGSTKYDFIVKPSGKADDIKVRYSGADTLVLEDGKLIVKNTINDFIEAKPYSYQFIDGKEVEVPCQYILNGNVLSYKFPKGYNKDFELIIDPVIVFSTLSGSTADNFGFTATYDHNENTYAGGIVYGQGIYPTTLGAYQTTFNTSPWYYVDVSISKFNINGTNLIYSTYLGGTRADAPHSLSVNNNDELFVMGTTGSADFPTTTGAHDTVFSGGVDVRPLYSGVNYLHGSDIFVARFNVAGSNLLGSTYVGGTGNDGVNTDANLAFNYGDAFRGEIVIDSNGNAIVASTTNSTNFPVTAGAPQTTFGGGFSDACLFRLNPSLTTITWSSYFGGTDADAGYGVQFDSYGDFYMTGGTRSNNLYTSTNALDRNFNGLEDGYLSRFNFTTNTIVASTYLGTTSYDQSYFVQLDNNDDVYVTGQSLGSYPVSAGVYSRAGSKQFFHKMSRTLDTSFWSTVVGSGRTTVDFSPSAFLVNDCGLIYLSGWGGVTNTYYRATGSSTVGLPITPDAFQSTTDGSDFYLMVLGKDAVNFVYGTFFGGGVSHEHVDGGTSRFDKKGNVYQAVCAGCGGNSDLPTTPGAWSRTNGSTNCNVGVLKMNIAYISSIASSIAPFICLPDSVNFVNRSSGGNTYKWYFGDGDSSSLFEPTHVYADTGSYTVTLIVSDSTGCVPPDTASITIDAYKPKALSIDSTPIICVGDTVQLNARNGQTYLWSPSSTLSNDTISNPLAFPITTTTYRLISDYYCNSDTLYTTVIVDSIIGDIKPDTTICEGSTIGLWATGGASYNWYPTIGMTSPTSATPQVSPTVPTRYYVDITSPNGCVTTDSVYVDFHNDVMSISPDTSACVGQTVSLSGTGGGSYLWSTGSVSSTINVSPSTTSVYTLSVVSPNGCNLQDSVTVTIFNDPHSITPDTSICPGYSATLVATGGGTYVWSTGNLTSSTTVTPSTTTTYSVVTTSPNGCMLYDTTTVTVHNDPTSIKPDTTICEGSTIGLWATGGASYNWYPTIGMTSPTSATPQVSPTVPTRYYVDITSPNGCVTTDSVYVDFHNDVMSISPDTSACVGQTVSLSGTGGGSYLWSTGSVSSTINVSPSTTSVYTLSVVSPNGCNLQDSVTVTIFNDPHSITPDTSICPGYSATLVATGGGTYVWSTGNLTSSTTVTPSTTTTYSVVTTSPNGCMLYDTTTVTVHNDPTSIKPDTTICEGSTIGLWATGGASYNWYPTIGMTSPTSATPQVSPTVPTRYYVDITSPNGCVTTDSVYVDFHNDVMSISPDTSACVGQTVSLSGTGGGSYLWSTGSVSSTINVSPSTTSVYTLSVVSPNGCNLQDSVTVTIFNDPHSITPDTSICPGYSATLVATGGGTYVWSTGNLTSSTTVTPSTTTTYSVVTTSPNGCMLYDTTTVTVHNDPTSIKPDTTICEGSTIGLWATGGASYNWYPTIGMTSPTSATPQVSPTVPTRYYVDITSPNGCVTTDSVYVDFHNDVMSISPDTSACVGQTVSLSGTGGGSYLWSTGSVSSTINVSPSTTSVYTLSVVSPNGCNLQDSVTVTIFNDPHSITPDTSICPGYSATLVATGGGTYVWSTGNLTSSTTVTPSTTTTYSVVTTSPNGCMLYDTTTVTVHNDPTSIKPDTTICEGSTIGLWATGGASYNWYPTIGMTSPTSATPQVSPTVPTRYYVDITSPNGCVTTDSVYVDFHNDVMSISPDTSACVGQTVSLSGTGGGSYLWSTGSVSSTINVSPSTTSVYTLSVVSPNGCNLQDSVTVTIFNDPHSITPDTSICPGYSATLVATGGGTYVWSTGNLTSSTTVTPSTTTTYSVVTTSPNGCMLYDTTTVTVHNDPTSIKPDTTICEGSTIGLWATGGASYNWYPTIGMTSPTSATPQVSPTVPTRYYVDITSPNGCVTTDSVYVDFHNDVMSISPDTSACVGQTVSLSGTGGGSYLWSTGSVSSTINVSPSTTSVYTLSVVSPNGCNLQDSVTVTIFNDPHSITPDTSICPGYSATLVATGGGTYVWSTGNLTSSTTVTPSTTTTYSVVTTSPNGCMLYDTTTVTVHNDPTSIKPDTTICEGSTIGLWATGGASYNWYPTIGMTSPTSATPQVSPTVPTRYYVDITSPNGCVTTDSVYVDFHNDVMSISPDTSACVGQTVSLSGTGGGSYLWSTGSVSSTINVSPSTTSVYTLSVVSPNGCNLQDSVTVTIFNDPHSITPDTSICPGYSATLVATGGGTYVWSTGNLTSSTTVTPSTTTTYSVVTTSPNGCMLYDTTTVTVHNDPTSIKPDTTICEGSTIGLWATGGASYNWYPTIGMTSPTSATPQVSPTVPTRYYVDITSPNGCVTTDSVYVDFHNDVMSISPDTSACVGQTVSLSGTGGGSYLWSTGSVSSTINVSPSTTSVYTLSVVSPNGCNLQDSVTVTIFNDPHSITPDTSICPGYSATLVATGGGTYVWSTGNLTSSTTVTPSTTTTYSVVTTSPNGCMLYDTTTVTVHNDPTSIKPDTTICEGSTIGLWATGGASYNWYPTIGMTSPTSATPQVSPTVPTRYYVDITSPNGCVTTDSVYVDFHNDVMSISPDTSACVGQTVSLSGTGGGSYLWSTGSVSSTINVSPSTTSVYTLSVVSPNGCNLQDSVTVTIFNDSMNISPDTTVCPGTTLILNSSGGGTYLWSSTGSIFGVNSSNPSVTPVSATQYNLTVNSPNGCVLRDSVTVFIHDEIYGTGPDAMICDGDTAQISAFGGLSYVWTPALTLTNPSISNPLAFPATHTMYNVSITSPNGCVYSDSVLVSIDTNRVNHTVSNDTVVCGSLGTLLSATGGTSYSWSPAFLLSSPDSASTMASPVRNTTFYVDISNNCFTVRDSIQVIVAGHNSIIIPDDTICEGDITTIFASGASSYSWESDPSIISGSNSAALTVQPKKPTTYKLNIVDIYGCPDSTKVHIDLHKKTIINAGKDVIIPLGESTNLLATGDPGPITWTPSSTLNCNTCRLTQAFPEVTTMYVVELTDENGCSAKDSVLVEIGGILRVPNTFTPNGDGFNDKFFAVGVNIINFRMQIFNRWGQLIFETTDIENGWDGTYLGVSCKEDTYVWKVTYDHLASQPEEIMGHVNLIK